MAWAANGRQRGYVAWALVALLGALATSVARAADAPAGRPGIDRPVRICCLGDSITQGGNHKHGEDEFTYRWPLFKMLFDHHVKFDFIGSRTQGLNADYKWPAEYKGVPFDMDHEGYYGRKTGKMAAEMPEIVKKWKAPPDIVLVDLGTNDQGAKDFTEAIVKPMEKIIEVLRERNPHVVVLVAQLAFNDGAALKIRPLVQAMADKLDTAKSPVKTVPMYAGWIAHGKDADTFGWVHPNPKGQEKMAEKWFAAMKPYLPGVAATAPADTATAPADAK